jgi:hypothetical protein
VNATGELYQAGLLEPQAAVLEFCNDTVKTLKISHRLSVVVSRGSLPLSWWLCASHTLHHDVALPDVTHYLGLLFAFDLLDAYYV